MNGSIHFEKVTSEQADRVFRLKESDIAQEDIRAFQDYLFWKICEIAAEVSLPLQCHTGMGQIIDTNVLQLNNVIRDKSAGDVIHGPWKKAMVLFSLSAFRCAKF